MIHPPADWIASSSASISVPPDGSCPESRVQGGTVLSAGLGANRDTATVVSYGHDAMLSGYVLGPGGNGIANASVCVYSAVVSGVLPELIGVVSTDGGGNYEFQLPIGPSRNITAVYRSDQGQLTAGALLQVRATASLRLAKNPVHNKHFAYFTGQIPGPENDRAMVVLQVQRGKGWLVFRRYSTRNGGKFWMRYRFTQTFSPTTYLIRAEVAGAPGYPYLPGTSVPKELRVLP